MPLPLTRQVFATKQWMSLRMILDLYLILLFSDEVVERSDASLHTASHLHGRVGGGCRREGGGGHPLRRPLALPQHPVRCPWEPALTPPHLFHLLLLLLLLLLQHQQHLMLLVLTLLLVNQKAAAADSLSGQQLQQACERYCRSYQQLASEPRAVLPSDSGANSDQHRPATQLHETLPPSTEGKRQLT